MKTRTAERKIKGMNLMFAIKGGIEKFKKQIDNKKHTVDSMLPIFQN